MPMNIRLPHEREEKEDQEAFTTMDREIALRHASTHPDLGQEDMYGNKAPQPQSTAATMATIMGDAQNAADAEKDSGS